jgi:putative phosphoesterase
MTPEPSMRGARHLVGVISDTHGLVRPEAVAALRGVELIIHAGDIGSVEVLAALEAVAPEKAIRGTNDTAPWARGIPETEVVEVGGVLIYVIHNLAELDLDPAAAGFHVVISGHSHKPDARRKAGILFLNPGSAGPRRFNLPICLLRLCIAGGSVEHELVHLSVAT